MNPEQNYRYTTSQVAQYYGLTGKGLAFYESKGIISPQRTANMKYREFSLIDCYHLYDSKFYSNCGFSLSETAELIGHADLPDLKSRLLKQSEQIARDICRQTRLEIHLKRLLSLLDSLDALIGQFQFTDSPAFYRLFVRRYFSPHESTAAQSHEFALWNQDIPINVASLKYDRDELISSCTQLNVNIGNIIREEDFHLLQYKTSDRTEYLPSRPCIYTVIAGNEEELYLPARLLPCLRYIEEQGLRLAGDPFTSMLIVAGTPQGRIRFDEAWFPVEGA